MNRLLSVEIREINVFYLFYLFYDFLGLCTWYMDLPVKDWTVCEIQQSMSHACVTTVQNSQLLASMLGVQLFLLEDRWLSKGISS
jgi:hypothetical protein